MKIQLDLDNKTIKLEADVKLSQLIDTLNKLLPNKEWKQYTLQTNTTIHHWSNPIVIHDTPAKPWPYWWGINYCSKSNADYKVDNRSQDTILSLKGVHNLEIK